MVFVKLCQMEIDGTFGVLKEEENGIKPNVAYRLNSKHEIEEVH